MFFRRKNLNILTMAVVMAAGLFVANAVFAQVDTGLAELSSTGLSQEDPRVVIAKIIKIILGFLGIVFLSLVIYGGFLWMIAGGSDQKHEKAKAVLVSAVIGLVIVLSAYAITTFVISRLGEATGAEIAGVPGGDGGFAGGEGGTTGGEGGTTGGANFYAKSFSPKGKVDAYNVKVSVLFNKDVKENSVAGNFIVRDVAGNKEVNGKAEVSGAKIIFTPDSKCAENPEKFCFAKNTLYEIEIKAGLRSAADTKLTCGVSFLCKSQFTTGAIFDASVPKVFVTNPSEWQSVKANTVLPLQAKASDNFGVSVVDFYLDDKAVGSDQPALGVAKEFDAIYDFDLTEITLGKHIVSAKAYDLAFNAGASAAVGFYVKPESCFNVKDELICGTPECGLCDGAKCSNDSQCAGGKCDKAKGTCIDLPMITGIAPAKGGAGNFVTVAGKYFEDFGPQSKVEFKNAKGEWIKAELGCGVKSWSKNQIIAVVPTGAVTGAVRVTNKKGYADATDDTRGWQGNFIYDAAVKWPGLCAVYGAKNTADGKFLDLVSAEGSGFGAERGDGDNVYFGEFSADISGVWQDKKITGIKVPNLKTGPINVKISNNNVLSNSVAFTVLETTELPTISGISPSNGGRGQYVTISGSKLGSVVGQVQFVSEGDPSKIYVAEFGCAQGGWNDSQVIVKVPTKIPPANIGKFSVQVVLGEVKSNQVLFDVNNKPVAPGICSIKPKNGVAGSKVEIVGEAFGGTQGDKGKVVFFSEAESKDGLTWADAKIFNVVVPQAAKSGPVYVLTSDGLKSNEVNFSVGSCTAGSCSAGETCCNGVCLPEAECGAAGLTSCEYAWIFSTGLLPVYPEVLEIPSCSKDFPESPSPMKDSKNACPNSEISAVFNTVMDPASFVDNVVVSACNSQKSDCDLSNCAKNGADCHNLTKQELGANPFVFSVVNYLGEDRTQFALKTKLTANLKYRLTLLSGTKGIKAMNGLALSNSYHWDFTTGENNCSIDHILISPSKAALNEFGAEMKYSAQCVAKNCNVIDCPSQSEWQWGFSNEGYAKSRALMDWDPDQAYSIVKALSETDANKDIELFSVFKSLDPKLPGEYGDVANLKIKFLDPKVVDQYPSCGTACPNSLIYAQFNTAMAVENNWPDKVNVLPCLSQACSTFAAAGQVGGNITYDGETKTANFILEKDSLLTPNTYYRVIVGGDVLSTSKKALTGLNYDKNGDGKMDAYSWTFKTKDDAAACKPQKVDIVPKKTTSYAKGDYILYFAKPAGDPKGCDGSGELLSPSSFAWSWESTKPSVAVISNDGRNPEFPEYCNSKCQVLGSLPKSKVAICGNGQIEIGEECDDGNIKMGDGCDAKCLREGTIACVNAGDANCCGNKIKDKNEDCDDGNAKAGDGCGAKCLYEGSAVAGFVCGNGKVEYGEDCDDGNVLSGDGCNSQCLNEGAKYISGKEPAVCGNGKFEAGEECETNDPGCGENCTWKGTAKCASGGDSNCCGNAKVEPGEECEVYDGWCTKNCLKKGSDSALGAICGNGKVESGEDGECECENGLNVDKKGDKCVSLITGKAPGNFYQMAKTVGDLPEDKVLDITNILAYPWDINAVSKVLDAKAITPGELTYSELVSVNGPGGDDLDEGGSKVCEGYGPVEFANTLPADGAVNICQNVSVVAEFNQPLNLDSLNGRVELSRFVGKLQLPSVAIEVESWQDSGTGNTVVSIAPKDLLEKNATYIVKFKPGIMDSCGNELKEELSFSFSAGGVCSASELTLIPSSKLFNKPGQEQEFSAIMKSGANYIHEVAGKYEWNMEWSLSEASKDIVGVKVSSKKPTAENMRVVFAKDKEGQDNLLQVAATIIVDALFGGAEKGKIMEAAATIDVIFCDNPWFWDGNKYSTDQNLGFGKFNIKTFYCRDAGKTEKLPLIKDVAGSKNTVQSPKIFYEVFFVRDAGNPGAPSPDYDYVSDAISLRVAENPDSLPVELWYKKNVPNPGGPQAMVMDGYQAIKDGRTIYVSGANVSVDQKIYNNVYILSYTDKANANTLAMVGQLLKYFKFNTNLQTLTKQKVQRDTKRVNDAAFVKYLLDVYFEIYKDFPHLDAGSYLKNIAYSAWPSWQNELGGDLQSALPEDPQNHFADVPVLAAKDVSVGGVVDSEKYQTCGAGYCDKNVSQCAAGKCRLCPVGYDVNTCYDSVNKKFGATWGLYQPIYSYQYSPANKKCKFGYYLESENLLLGYQYSGKPVVCQ